ncbi:unnamed protein product [Malus baccata var. baccata]
MSSSGKNALIFYLLSLNLSSIEPLSGENYKKWREDVEIVLGLMDLDLALREDEPAPLIDDSTPDQKMKFGKWEKVNRMALMVMKRTMSDTVRGGFTTCDKAKDFLEAVGAKFRESEKAQMGDLMMTLTTLKLDDNKREKLDVPIDDAFIVHMALNLLPPKFNQLKISYNTQKEKWVLDDLILICAQEEARTHR